MIKNWTKPTVVLLANSTIKGNGDVNFTYEDVCVDCNINAANTCASGCGGYIKTYVTGLADNGYSCFTGGLVGNGGTSLGAFPFCS